MNEYKIITFVLRLYISTHLNLIVLTFQYFHNYGIVLGYKILKIIQKVDRLILMICLETWDSKKNRMLIIVFIHYMMKVLRCINGNLQSICYSTIKVPSMLWNRRWIAEQADEINRHGFKIDKTDSNLLPIASKSIKRT